MSDHREKQFLTSHKRHPSSVAHLRQMYRPQDRKLPFGFIWGVFASLKCERQGPSCWPTVMVASFSEHEIK